MSILEVTGLEVTLGAFRLSASFSLHRHVTGIFGPSGSGKTTLLEVIAGLHRARTGTIQLGQTILSDSARRRFIPPEKRRIGYVPQDLALFPHLTVQANILYGAAGHPELLTKLLSVLELKPLLNRFPENLSGGEKQRVAIARALVTSPALLLLDEPLSSLDHALKETGLHLFRKIQEQFTTPILYVSHDPGEIAFICEEVLVLSGGRITHQGNPSSVLTNTQLRSKTG